MVSYRGLRYRIQTKARYWFSPWPIANLLNRSPRTCWGDLVSWALYAGDSRDPYMKLRYSLSGGSRCQAESAMHRDRMCYCAKFVNGCHGKARDTEFAKLLAADQHAHEQTGERV